MMKRFMLLTMILVFVSVCGCEMELDGDYEAPEDQAVLFEYRYVNHAWGYAEEGWLIDADGIMRGYKLPDGYRRPDSLGLISMEDLNYNLSQCDSILGEVPSKDLEYYTGLIDGASLGEIGKAENIAADAGSSVLSCYMYDSSKDMYQYIFLASSGDWQQANDAPEAVIIVEWLKDLGVFWLSL